MNASKTTRRSDLLSGNPENIVYSGSRAEWPPWRDVRASQVNIDNP